MSKTLRIVAITGILVPLLMIWNIDTASLEVKFMFIGIQLVVGFMAVIVLEFIFRRVKNKKKA